MRAGRPKNRRQYFEQRVEQLVAYRQKHDRWPEAQGKDAEERSIGTWCKKIKELYKTGRLESIYADRFREIGYPMDFLHDHWQRHFELLSSFIEQHRRLPSAKDRLYSYCYYQYRFAGQLSTERKLKLTGIGFFDLWEEKKAGKMTRWEANYKKLKAFIAINGALPSNETGRHLKHWLKNQKQLFAKGRLSQARVKRFELAGLDLHVRPFETASWKERLDAVKIYYLAHGELPVCKVDLKLYNWLLYQKNLYRQGKLSDQKISSLNSIDRDWWKKKRKLNSIAYTMP